jgi:hypothetical protein
MAQDEDFLQLQRENTMLHRRMERMTKEMRNLVALHDRAMKFREYSEREKNLQYAYNVLLLNNAPDLIFILNHEYVSRSVEKYIGLRKDVPLHILLISCYMAQTANEMLW